jgi:hypothetical protein
VKLAAVSSRDKGAKVAKDLWKTARAEHMIISMLYPFDEVRRHAHFRTACVSASDHRATPTPQENLGVELSAVQCVQIFYNTLVLEVLLIASWFVPAEGDEGGGFMDAMASAPLVTIVGIFRDGIIVVGPCVSAAIMMRLVFRWGNKGRRQRPKRERAAASELDAKKRGPAEKLGARRRTAKGRASAARFWGVWAFMLVGQLIQMLFCIIYGYKIGEDGTGQFLTQWAITLGMQSLAVEPLEVSLARKSPRARTAPRPAPPPPPRKARS